MSATALDAQAASKLEACVVGGGVAIFPTDTVYGVCCDPDSEAAVRRLYELKARPPKRPAAVMFFSLDAVLASLGELVPGERAVLETLLPGAVTLLLPNRGARFLPACADDPATIGVRVPQLSDALAPLQAVNVAVMQSSANLSGQPDARTLAEVPVQLRENADLVLDGGVLVGKPSTVIDLCHYASRGEWRVVREGALSVAAVGRLLDIGRPC
jgi:L-threonylcarbamoyladenylate synthase